jgi:hypothetical protein
MRMVPVRLAQWLSEARFVVALCGVGGVRLENLIAAGPLACASGLCGRWEEPALRGRNATEDIPYSAELFWSAGHGIP